jgi:hypothetical protein
MLAIWRTGGLWPSSIEIPPGYEDAEILRLPSLDAMTAEKRKIGRRVVLNDVPVFLSRNR